MIKKIVGILVCMLLIAATVLPVAGNKDETIDRKDKTIIDEVLKRHIVNDFIMPSGKELIPVNVNYNKLNLNTTYGHLSGGNSPVPEYEFIKNPTTIVTSFYDYMPGSYASHPIRVQTEHGDGHYLTFFGRPSTSANRRQYWSYVDENCNILDNGVISTYDYWQGYGGIGIHPATGDCIASWHENYDGGGVLETAITFDDYDAGENPGAWESPLIVYSTGGMEYIWPYIYVGPSPQGEGYVRVYQVANNAAQVGGLPCEDVRIIYADVEDVNGADLSVLLDSVSWSNVTVFTDWRDKKCRPFQSFAIDYSNPGKVGFIGSAVWLEGDQGDMPVDEGVFVWESFDYGETWDTANLHSDSPSNYLYLVDNPGFEQAPDQLEVMVGGWHNTALYDSMGNLHATFLQQYGFSDVSGSYYFPYFMPQAEMVWNGANFSFREVPELPGIDALSGHSVPWDDTYLYPVIGWSTYTSGVFHENMQKQAINADRYWMAQMWVDGTYAQLAKDDPGFDQNYLEHPIIFISVSSDNGNTWSEPIELTDIYSELFDFSDQITVYPYISDQIIDLGDDWGQIYVYYFDDNDFGSNVHGYGPNTGGQITYCSIKIKFPEQPHLEIKETKGGLGKVGALIENTGDLNATEIFWSISVNGGILGLIDVKTEGSIGTFDAGTTVTVQTDKFIFGLGKIEIKIITIFAETWTGTGFVLGPFILGVKEG